MKVKPRRIVLAMISMFVILGLVALGSGPYPVNAQSSRISAASVRKIGVIPFFRGKAPYPQHKRNRQLLPARIAFES